MSYANSNTAQITYDLKVIDPETRKEYVCVPMGVLFYYYPDIKHDWKLAVPSGWTVELTAVLRSGDQVFDFTHLYVTSKDSDMEQVARVEKFLEGRVAFNQLFEALQG
jgi:hypothetical protein